MPLTVTSLLVLLLLTSCSTTEDTRYRDNSILELPPSLRESLGPVKEENKDDSALSDNTLKKGLGDAVSMSASEPPVLMIKQPFGIAWNTLESALNQNEIEIKDRNLEKGVYYVTFDPDSYTSGEDSLVRRWGSVFVNEYSKAVYVLTLMADGDETQIEAAKANESEQGSVPDQEQPEDDEKTDGSKKLLLSLYQTLRDDFIEQ